ncbi:MAG TPA: hypothetical protein VGQ75_08110, partial [Thermoanaerobaculia bacterium]|nr:hypothetical protein [Thermoanaerobaculia bacterium]
MDTPARFDPPHRAEGRSRARVLAIFAIMIAFASGSALGQRRRFDPAGGFPGAIFTTDQTCTVVD